MEQSQAQGGAVEAKRGGMYENQTVKHGFDTQAKSKEALNRIQQRVKQTIDLADDSLTNLEKQNE